MRAQRRLAVLILLAILGAGRLAGEAKPAESKPAESDTAGAPGTFSLVNEREPVASLVGLWRFKPGDDPGYADPKYDDSQWKLLRSDMPWSGQGFKGLSGYGWYRFRVTLPGGGDAYSLLLPQILTSFQCFADGKLVSTTGSFPPDWSLHNVVPVEVKLPFSSQSGAQARTITVALRVWHAPIWASYMGGGPHGRLERVGRADLIEKFLEERRLLRQQQATADLALGVLNLLAGMISITLYMLRRSQWEYLWFGVAVMVSSVMPIFTYFTTGVASRVSMVDAANVGLLIVALLASLLFYKRLLGGRRSWLMTLAVVCIFGHIVPILMAEEFGTLRVGPANLVALLLQIPFFLWLLVLLVQRSGEHVTDARLLLVPVVLVYGTAFAEQLLSVFQTFGHRLGVTWYQLSIKSPFLIAPDNVANAFFLLAMLAILMNRFARTSREQDRTAAELEAARSLQQVLIPETLPETPGLRIETAYYPAQEVGGDFFQIIPLLSGSTLVVLGDVSGKGLPAAMTVSLAVGAIRTLAEFTASPGELLGGLNRRLHGRGSGFTTCLALRFEPGGVLTLANAGHLAPYRNGREMAMPPELPLGLDPDASFAEERVQLGPGDHLTLLTDGVPEATCRRELFGFERTASMSAQPAALIAQAARSFGHADDITVLTIEVAAAEEGLRV